VAYNDLNILQAFKNFVFINETLKVCGESNCGAIMFKNSIAP
jgi:hypothetical protein